MSFESLMNKTATVRAKSVASDSRGGQIAAWANLETSVLCALQPLSDKEIIEDRNLTIGMYRAFFPASSAVTEEHRVIIDSITYEVKSVADGGGRGHHKELLLKTVKT